MSGEQIGDGVEGSIDDFESRKVETLQKYGCPEKKLWLTECHSGADLLSYYSEDLVFDLGVEEAFGVVYHHESGSINQIAAFNDEESFEDACAYVASYLRDPKEWPPNRYQKFFNESQWSQLLINGKASAESEGGLDHKPVVKIFSPDANATFLLSEAMPHDSDIAFGLCDPGLGSPELGYASLQELDLIRGSLGLPMEKDLHFRAGKTLTAYAEEAQQNRRIVV